MTRKDAMKTPTARPIEDDLPPPVARPRPRRPLAAGLATTAAVAVILYVALLVLSRTAGFRSFLAGQLEKRTGLACALGGSGLSPSLGLTLSDVEIRDREDPAAGLHIRSLRLSGAPFSVLFGMKGVRAIRVDGAQIVFARGADGQWKPEAAASLAGTLDALSGQGLLPSLPVRPSEPASVPAPARPESARPAEPAPSLRIDILLDARRINAEWRDGGDTPEVALEEVSFRVTPIVLPDRRMTHVAISVGRLARRRGETMRNVRTEFLLLGSQRILLGFDVGSEGSSAAPLPAMDSFTVPTPPAPAAADGIPPSP